MRVTTKQKHKINSIVIINHRSSTRRINSSSNKRSSAFSESTPKSPPFKSNYDRLGYCIFLWLEVVGRTRWREGNENRWWWWPEYGNYYIAIALLAGCLLLYSTWNCVQTAKILQRGRGRQIKNTLWITSSSIRWIDRRTESATDVSRKRYNKNKLLGQI